MDKYINKEETIERINRLFTKNHDGSVAKNDYNSGLYAAKAEIVFITAADVQLMKRGEWVSDEYGVHCSHCNKTPPTEEVQCGCQTVEDYILSDFCPHCGADMRNKEG